MPRHRWILCLALLVLVAVPLGAYTIYLKDGSRVLAKEKYRIEEGRAIITLQSGTQTFIDASEIDLQRTEEANRSDYGTALVLEDGKFTEASPEREEDREDTLTDLAGAPGLTLQDRPVARRPTVEAPDASEGQRTLGGYLDFNTLPRTSIRQPEVSGEVMRVFRDKGLEDVQVFQGSRPEHMLVEVVANSEAAAFRGLEAASLALLRVLRDFPGGVAGLELLMLTSARERAGQFVMNPQDAADLVQDRLEISAYYVENVQF